MQILKVFLTNGMIHSFVWGDEADEVDNDNEGGLSVESTYDVIAFYPKDSWICWRIFTLGE